jgi:hypothetical protein
MVTSIQRDTRLIEHLTLNEVPRAAIRHTVFLIEDALRTASLSGSDRSLYLIRHLDLGDIYPHQTAAELSRRFELSWSRHRTEAVDGRAPHAAAANVVAFPSFAALLAHYFKRRFLSEPCDDWFFIRHIPPMVQRAQNTELLALTLQHLHSAPAHREEPSILPEFVLLLQEQGIMTEVIEATSPAAIRTLLSVWLPNFLAISSVTQPEAARPAVQSYLPTMHELIASALRAIIWKPQLYRSTALDAYLESVSMTGSHASFHSKHERPASRRNENPVHSPGWLDSTAIQETWATEMPTTVGAEAQISEATVFHNLDQPEDRTEGFSDPSTTIPSAYQPPVLLPTHLGGLYFVLHILDRLNFFATVPEEEQPLLLESILHLSATASGIDPLDPLWVQPLEVHPKASGWFQQLRVWPRSNARMLLNWVIRRPALCRMTRSHIDIHFSLNQADIRLRKLGLDLNPGWILCLGKVITFHYDEHLV